MSDRRFFRPAIACFSVALLFAFAMPAQALSMKECSIKYKAAQAAGEAEGLSWSDFRKAQCSAPVDAAATPDASEPAGKKAETVETEPEKANKAEPETKAASGKTTFPTSISSKFASEKPAKARMHTCLEQYHVNKNANTLGDLRWINKGGGYYSLCNAKLKGNG